MATLALVLCLCNSLMIVGILIALKSMQKNTGLIINTLKIYREAIELAEKGIGNLTEAMKSLLRKE